MGHYYEVYNQQWMGALMSNFSESEYSHDEIVLTKNKSLHT